MDKSDEKNRNVVNGYDIATNAKGSQSTKYTCGKDGSTGGGFAAEDANALYDNLCGKDVDKVGISNEKNGADRISGGIKIQTKYCKTARATVNAAFDSNTGQYKYTLKNGRPMKLEVPYDQYDQAVNIIKEKIAEGKIKGVKNPEHATKMVKQGIVTYEQAARIAKAGRIESILYDAATGTVTSAISAGISATITFYAYKKRGAKTIEAAKAAGKQGLKSGGSVMATQVIVGQAERIIIKQASKKVSEEGAKAASRGIMTNIAKSAARTNIITGVVTTAVTSIPDINKARKGKITWSECGGRVAVNSGSVAAGMALGAKCAALAGPIPIPGSSFVAGLAGGIVGSVAASSIGNAIKSKLTSFIKKRKNS